MRVTYITGFMLFISGIVFLAFGSEQLLFAVLFKGKKDLTYPEYKSSVRQHVIFKFLLVLQILLVHIVLCYLGNSLNVCIC